MALLAITLPLANARVATISYGQVPERPGLNINVQQSLAPELAGAITPIIQQLITGANVPDQSGQFHIPLYGPIQWNITDIVITSMTFDDPVVTPIAPNGAEFSVADGSGGLTANWKWQRVDRIIKTGDSGSATVDLSEVSLVLELDITMVNFRPVLTLTTCDLAIGKMDIHVSSPWTGWIYNFFLWLFNGIVKRQVEHTVESKLAAVVSDTINPALMSMPIYIQIVRDLYVGDAMLASPNMTSSDATFYFDGGFYLANASSPYVPVPMPNNCTQDMLNVMIADYMFNSAAYALYKASVFNVTLTPDNVPEKMRPLLNTTTWIPIIPGLNKNYPATLMDLSFIPSESPTLNITTSGIKGTLNGDINFAIPSDSGSTVVLTLAMDGSLSYDPYFSSDNNTVNGLHLKISDFSFKLKETYSSIGRVSTTLVSTMIKTLADVIIIPAVNDVLNNHGIPLPIIPSMELIDTNFNFYDSYMCFHTSVNIPVPTLPMLDI